MADLQGKIEELWERRGELSPADTEAAGIVEEAIELLDSGQARVAEVDATTDEVVVHEWLKKSILMLFLFYIPDSFLEPAGTRDVDSQCQP